VTQYDEPLRKLADVADLLGVSQEWLRLQCLSGRVPHVRVARHYRFTDAHVAEIVAQFSVVPGPDEPANKTRGPRRNATRRYASYPRGDS
jgi:Helix-turn-helix domain